MAIRETRQKCESVLGARVFFLHDSYLLHIDFIFSNLDCYQQRTDSPSVQFGHVRVREHRRTLGGKHHVFAAVLVQLIVRTTGPHARRLSLIAGSCGVPYTGSISLGLSNEYQDFKAVDIDVYERIRQSEGRCLQETPEKVRRMLLEADMGSENFEKRLREEQTSLARTRIYREVRLCSCACSPMTCTYSHSLTHSLTLAQLMAMHRLCVYIVAAPRTPWPTTRATSRPSRTTSAMKCTLA